MTSKYRGFSLGEMLAVVVLVGIVAAIVLPRLAGADVEMNRQACCSQKGQVELAVQRWWRIHAAPPAANLSDIGADLDYFPEGLPTCPVDGSAYTIDTTTGEVVGHSH